MGNNLADLTTDRELIEAMKDAAGHKLTASEVLEQKISFVYSAVDERSGITHERIRSQLMEHEGRTEPVK